MAHIPADVVRIEADALRALAARLAGPMAPAFERALALVHGCKGRVVVTGMGKSGIVARKIAATLSSTGTPSLFLHPAEALHGDLGMVVKGDVVLALSSSGETEEILRLLATLKRLEVPVISFTGDSIYSEDGSAASGAAGGGAASGHARAAGEAALAASRRSSDGDHAAHKTPAHAGRERRASLRISDLDRIASAAAASAPMTPAGATARLSTLAAAADVALDCSVAQEACSLGLAPTASTATMMALGDALAMALSQKRGFKEEDFANLHPGGKLGKRLARVESLMHTGNAVPRVEPHTRMPDVIYEMSRKGLGITTVVDGDKLVGIVSDGDLRRLLEKQSHNGRNVLELTAADCMTRHPKTIAPDAFAAAALNAMEQKKITSLVVVDTAGRVVGLVHLHDLWQTEVV